MRLSILIPTCNRHNKLLRLLHHLVLQFQDNTNLYKKLNLEIIIADGSEKINSISIGDNPGKQYNLSYIPKNKKEYFDLLKNYNAM